jgi:hypothetical protein
MALAYSADSTRKGASLMAIEDKSQPSPLSHKPLPPFSPEDEKKAQQELARLRRHKKRGFEGKTLWDWLKLLGVPIFLAFATIGFGFVQFYLADQQHVQDQNIALDQQHATTLQTYIDNIQDLLLNHKLAKSKPDDEIATLAQARTLTALEGLGLDSDRKGRLLQFLYEAQLIGFLDGKGNLHPIIISLKDAKFNYATHILIGSRGLVEYKESARLVEATGEPTTRLCGRSSFEPVTALQRQLPVHQSLKRRLGL